MKCNKDCFNCVYDDCILEEKFYDRREYAKKYHSQNRDRVNQKRREQYEEKKKNRICIRCQERATHGLYCYEHSIQEKKRSAARAEASKRKRHDRGLIDQYRINNHLCRWCGKPATGGTMACDYHRKIFAEASKKGNKDVFDQLNTLVSQGGQ